jgi:protease I
MAGRLHGRSIVVLLAEGFEDLEFWVTVMRLREEDARVTIAGLQTEPVHGKNALAATPRSKPIDREGCAGVGEMRS